MPTLPTGKLALLPLAGLLAALACGDASSPSAIATPGDVEFGEVDVGGSAARGVTLTNTSGAPLDIVDVITSGVGVTASGRALPFKLAPGETMDLSLELAPTTSGDVSGSVSLLSASGTESLGQIRTVGRGVRPNTLLVPAPAAVAFDEVTVGARATTSVTLTNNANQSLRVTSLAASAAGVTVTGLPLPATFAPGESATLEVAFAPAVAGAVTGSFALKSEQGRPLAVVEIAGTAVSPEAPVTLTATPSRLDFGNVTVGSFSAQGVTLTNPSSQAVTVSDVVTAGTSFSGSGLVLPATLPPGGSATLSVKYTPAAIGIAAGQVTVRGAAGETLAAVDLAGSGVAASSITSVTVRDATVEAGKTVQLVADVVAVGTIDKSVTWSVGTLGTVDAKTGLYTAPAVPGVYRVWATSNANPAVKGSALVTVTSAPATTEPPPTTTEPPPTGDTTTPDVTLGAPNGSDDTAAFNSAITAANGGVVAVPGSGTYVVRSVAVSKAGTTIVCTGTPAATIKLKPLASGDGSPIFNVTAGAFTLKNCILDGNKAAQPAGGFNDSYTGRSFRAGIKMDGWFSGLTVDKAEFRNTFGAAIAPRNVSAISVTNSVFRDNYFESVFASNTYVVTDPSTFVDGFRFIGNTVTNTRSRDSSVNANALLVYKTRNVNIENNVFDGFERNAMKLENCRTGLVSNNRIANGDMSGWAGIGMQNGAHYITISGNHISNTGAGIDTSLVVGGQSKPDTVDHLTIRGNTITSITRGTMPDGIRILSYSAEATDLTIAENTIQQVTRYGINLRQFTTFYSSPTFSRIAIQSNRLTSAGSCSNWFAGTTISPTSVTDSGNTCN